MTVKDNKENFLVQPKCRLIKVLSPKWDVYVRKKLNVSVSVFKIQYNAMSRHRLSLKLVYWLEKINV